MNEKCDTAMATYSPTATVNNRQKSRLGWPILIVGAALGSTAAWIGFIVWLFVWAAGTMLA